VLYGLGAAAGPLLTGRLADRIGFSPALRGSLVILPVAIALPAITASGGWLVLSGVIAGGYTTGVVPLILGRLYQVLPASQHRLAWSYATICFALFQAGLAYGFSAIFAYSGQYAVIFLGGSAAALLALLLDFTPVSRRE
jgi:predicted MFS family arabinose efflux permease